MRTTDKQHAATLARDIWKFNSQPTGDSLAQLAEKGINMLEIAQGKVIERTMNDTLDVMDLINLN